MSGEANETRGGDLSRFLPWLVEMGADEILLDQPVNRFATPTTEPAVAPKPAAKALLLKTIPPPPPPRRPTTGEEQSPEALAGQATTLPELSSAFSSFKSHPLERTATKLCFVSGASSARVLVLCDKPRTPEDPVGDVLAEKHRVLAERMFAAIGLCGMEAREGFEQVMLANVIPWRPPGNRAVTEKEARDCVPFAMRLLEIAQPQLILAFGALPGQYLSGSDAGIVKARGQWTYVNNIPMMTTFHPETLLKSPQSKRLAWADLQAFRAKLDALS
jgi:uracil-DNA glycosylase